MTAQNAISTVLRDGINVLFQPIFNFGGDVTTVYAYEALSRGRRGTSFERADVLFDFVRLAHDEVRVDRHCVATGIAEGAELTRSAFLTLNVHASTIESDADFPRYVAEVSGRCGVDPHRLIFELVEQTAYSESRKLLPALDRLREMGIRIAIDDVGIGHANYRAILDVRPDFLKIDRYFVQNCDTDRGRQVLLRSITSLAADFNATVIAEGIERDDELAMVRSMGITYGQGFLLGRPSKPDPALTSPTDKTNVILRFEIQEKGEPMSRKKILLVDDSATILMMERMILSKGPYEVVTAANGEEGVAKAVSERPDLILMDVVMPKMNGFDAVRHIRQHSEVGTTPIIMVTTRGEMENVESGFSSGCNDYVTKPINAPELMTKLKALLG
jgi:EAL domain-containing protein (putative c-di-GMP-specific phosphodiesterase class I)/CheY-like chemotaxis protein